MNETATVPSENQLTGENNYYNIEPIMKRLDIIMFALLFAIILLYRLQLVATWISDLHIREILYVYLYLRALTSYRIHVTNNLLMIVIYLLMCALVGLYTYVLYGSLVAFSGFARFINVALLAPLACILFRNLRQVRTFVFLWLVVVILGAVTAWMQLAGVDMSWLTRDYIAIREGKTRFMTILGEPNVGGMASVILSAFIINLKTRPLSKTVLVFSAAILFLLSVSKAAIAGFLLLIVLVLIGKFPLPNKIYLKFKKSTFAVWIMIFLLLSVAFLTQTRITEMSAYWNTAVNAFVGGDSDNYSFTEDLKDRLFSKPIQGIKIAKKESIFSSYFVNVLVGSSFGVAGSSAFELRKPGKAMLPHNSYMEIYLVGGVLLLLAFTALCIYTLRQLWLKSRNDLFRSFLFASILLLAFMFTYPVIYEPITGGIFWLIIGVAGNPVVKAKLYN